MDFKIGDEIEDYQEEGEEPRKSSKLPLIIVIIVAILCGLLVFVVSNAIFGKKVIKRDPVVSTPLSLTEENVQILYQYVTYGTRGVRNDKFLKEQNVTLDSFSNQERFYYALQFAQVEDFISTGKTNDKGKKIYRIASSQIQSYMKRFFGGEVTYSENAVITYPFSFRINNQNVGIMTYSEEKGGFETIFDGLEEDIVDNSIVKPYYTELVNAYKEPDGSYKLVEKVIYTVTEQVGETYTVYIYKDYAHTMLIETKTNQTAEMLKNYPIELEDYKDKASTVTYLFKIDDDDYTLYFDSSSITTN